jgi:nucleotide-binding universal stress UspA family protein
MTLNKIPSFHAARVGINLANKFNSKIIVLYVVVPPSKYEYSNLVGIVTPKQIDKIIQNAKEEARTCFKRIEDMIKKENTTIKLTTLVIVTEESIYGEIIQYAQIESIDLIVIGTRGRSGFKRVLLGSTASGVVTYANCPVTVTK